MDKEPCAQEQTGKFLNLVFACFQAKDTEIRGTRLVITGLKTGGKYRFRVIAFNAAGNGEAGEVPEVLEVNDRTGECLWVRCFQAPFPPLYERGPNLKAKMLRSVCPSSCSGG